MLPDNEAIALRREIWNDFTDKKSCFVCSFNIAEGASRRSEAERKRFYEIARGSVIEIDAALDIANTLEYLSNKEIEKLGKLMVQCFRMLCGLIESQQSA